jgi:hypothetical protein
MKTSRVLCLVTGLCACATGSSAPSGTVARAQQDYNQALQKCQEEYRRDGSIDAGLGATTTPDDAKFSQCVNPAKTTLDAQMRQAAAEEARLVGDAGSAG